MTSDREIKEDSFSTTLISGYKYMTMATVDTIIVESQSELMWHLQVVRTHPDSLTVKIQCTSDSEKSWKVSASFTLHVYNKTEEEAQAYFRNYSFDNDATAAEPLIVDVPSKDYDHWGKIKLSFLMKILSSTEKRDEKPCPIINTDFTERDADLHDVTLVVEGKELFATKAVLSTFSPVFRAMFNSGFREKSENKVKIKNVQFEDLQQLLQLLHHQKIEIHESNVLGLLMVADLYDVPFVTKKCEKFLLNNDLMEKADKLRLADAFRLLKLQNSVEASK